MVATMFKAFRKSGSSWAVPLILCAFFVRMMIPSGWMPTVDGAGYTRISLCTGMGEQAAWIDTKGGLHKSDPGKKQQETAPCVFASLGAALDVPHLAVPDAPVTKSQDDSGQVPVSAAIGQGLAAPPPPSTGPPILI
jgi:hypothetical protein